MSWLQSIKNTQVFRSSQPFLKLLHGRLQKDDLSRQAERGRVVYRRLNREEYANTLHDLLGVDTPLLEMLPEDGTSHGFNTVGEALICGVPAIASTGTPWKQLEEVGCGWTCEPTVSSLEKTMRIALSHSAETLLQKGQVGNQWVMKTFSWSSVARRLLETYSWLSGNTSRPSHVFIFSYGTPSNINSNVFFNSFVFSNWPSLGPRSTF